MPLLDTARATIARAIPPRAGMQLAVTALGVTIAACGSSQHRRTGDLVGTVPVQSGIVHTAIANTITTSVIPAGQSLRGDSDADNPLDKDGNGDLDVDGDVDSPVPESYRLPDTDDKAVFTYGTAAGVRAGRAIRRAVLAYYVAAQTGNGAAACRLLTSSLARSAAVEFGRYGPSYLHGAKTCEGVLSRLFTHYREELAEAITIVHVGVAGKQAQAILSSRKLPASSISLQRQREGWRIRSLIGLPLP